MDLQKGSGLLLHITSLPSLFGAGDFGPAAYRFIDWLHEAGQTYWQVLPFNPTDMICGHSPYNGLSTFALNPLFISPALLMDAGLVSGEDLAEPLPSGRHISFPEMEKARQKIFRKACRAFRTKQSGSGYHIFREASSHWLDDYALFMALRDHLKETRWARWPAEVRDREPGALADCRERLADKMEMRRILQYLAHTQYEALRVHAAEKSVRMIGDLPIYMDLNSADVWSRPALFKLDSAKHPAAVAGVPPDYFSKTGQLWGNPVYDWDVHQETGFEWWLKRLGHHFRLFDLCRIDHFRGLAAYWEVTAGEKTAVRGRWVPVPSEDFFRHVHAHFDTLPVIAEDLGDITPDVTALMENHGLPGMKVLQFGFDGELSANPHYPDNIPEHAVVYTGTHDNDTLAGWLKSMTGTDTQQRIESCIGTALTDPEANWALVETALKTRGRITIFPVQDILGLDSSHRMNTPGTARGNWTWRMQEDDLGGRLGEKLRKLTERYGRM